MSWSEDEQRYGTHQNNDYRQTLATEGTPALKIVDGKKAYKWVWWGGDSRMVHIYNTHGKEISAFNVYVDSYADPETVIRKSIAEHIRDWYIP